MTTADPYTYFRVEAREILDQLGSVLIELERTHPPETTARLLRLAHTLKGAARVFRQVEIANLAHALEDALAPHRAATAPLAREDIDAALALVDAMSNGLRALDLPALTEEIAESTPPQPELARTIRADVAEVEAVLGGLGDLHGQIGALRGWIPPLERARHLSVLLADSIVNPRGRDGGESLRAAAADLRDVVNALERGVTQAIAWLDRDIGTTRDAAERLRLIRVGEMFAGLERTARDLARAQGKRVAVELDGAHVRLDAHVIEIVQGALLQIVRNAVAHGIETEGDRRAHGKPVEGRIVVSVARRGRSVVVQCRDDGRGVDVDAVRDALRRRGEPAVGSDEAIVDRLLQARVSTASSVTQAAGRGVGLDVVREAAKRLGAAGYVVKSAFNQGDFLTRVRALVRVSRRSEGSSSRTRPRSGVT